MGRHKNTAQEAIFINFMEQHKNLARGFVKGDRVVAEALCYNLKTDLNSHGPLHKDASAWKKVWMDWKGSIKKKLSHNKAEDVSTGGGPFNKFVESPMKDAIAKFCGIYTVVKGIPNTMDFGLVGELKYGSNNSMPKNSQQIGQEQEAIQVAEPALPAAAGRKRKIQAIQAENNIEELIAKQIKAIEQIGEKMDGIVTASSKLARVVQDIDHSMKKLHKSNVDSLQNCLPRGNLETQY